MSVENRVRGKKCKGRKPVRRETEKGTMEKNKKMNRHFLFYIPNSKCQRLNQTADLIRKVKVRITLSFSCTSMFPAFFNGSVC